MDRRAVFALLVATSLSLHACVPAGKHTSLSTRDVITADEIARVGATSALEAIQRLQPQMLEKRRGPSSFALEDQIQIVVFVDGARMGGVDTLGLVQASSIVEIRFLSASEATIRYGSGYAAGAILVTTKT